MSFLADELLRWKHDGMGCCSSEMAIHVRQLVREEEEYLGIIRENKILKKQLESAKRVHQFCPDCRDKVREEPCLRCQCQSLQRKLDRSTLPTISQLEVDAWNKCGDA